MRHDPRISMRPRAGTEEEDRLAQMAFQAFACMPANLPVLKCAQQSILARSCKGCHTDFYHDYGDTGLLATQTGGASIDQAHGLLDELSSRVASLETRLAQASPSAQSSSTKRGFATPPSGPFSSPDTSLLQSNALYTESPASNQGCVVLASE